MAEEHDSWLEGLGVTGFTSSDGADRADVRDQSAAAESQQDGKAEGEDHRPPSGAIGQDSMQPDCVPVHGKVPGPANHLLCSTHGHVLDVSAKVVIAKSLEDYKKRHPGGGGRSGGKQSNTNVTTETVNGDAETGQTEIGAAAYSQKLDDDHVYNRAWNMKCDINVETDGSWSYSWSWKFAGPTAVDSPEVHEEILLTDAKGRVLDSAKEAAHNLAPDQTYLGTGSGQRKIPGGKVSWALAIPFKSGYVGRTGGTFTAMVALV